MAGKGRLMDGLLFPDFFPEENFHLIRSLELRDIDLLMTTFPKCGTHWTMYTIYGIVHPEEPAPDSKSLYTYCRFLDELGLDKSKVVYEDQGQTFNTHLPINFLKKNATTKFVGVIRNPLDCCVSMYKFLEHMGDWKDKANTIFRWKKDSSGKIPDDFFNDFAQGKIVYGDIFKYIKALYERKDDSNVHMVVFEKMKANPKAETLRLARFLGHAEKLEADNGKLLDKVVEQSSFDSMKKVSFKHPAHGQEMEILRKGEAGGFRDVLTAEQIKILKEKIEKELAGTELLDLWKDL